MRALISRTLVLHLSSHPPLFRSAVLFHSAVGEDAHRRRAEPLYSPTSSHPYGSSSSQRRNYEEENRSIKVTVWWDFENCQVPVGLNVERVANRITSVLRSTGIKGPITISAFGDVAMMSRGTQEALTSTGVCLNHVPHRGKNSSDRSFMADLVYWVSQNPPPAHFFLISSDKDFANILHRLRMSNYNILLASNDLASGVLRSAATIMWPWTELVKGENVTAKHYNHPPDGLYGSWYGHYKGALDDPFQGSDTCAISQPEESMEPISEIKVRSIPRVVVNGIRNVLHSYPEGMYISELRAELRRKNISVDKDLYGHKKFSSLLASMPSIVRFIPNASGEGQPLVADKRWAESVEIGSKASGDSAELRSKTAKEAQTIKVEKNRSLTREKKPETLILPDNIGVGIPAPTTVDVNAAVPTTIPVDVSAVVPSSNPVQDAVPEGVKTARPTSSDKGHDLELKEGMFKRIWATLTGHRNGHLDLSDKNDITSEAACTPSEQAIKDHDHKNLESEVKAASPDSSSHASSSSNAFGHVQFIPEVPEEKSAMQSEKQNGTSNVKIGFFSQLANWWNSWNSATKDQKDSAESAGEKMEADGNEEQIKDVNSVSSCPQTPAIFSRSHFWDALESFLLTSKGADIILKSSTRYQLAHKLQKEGPCILKGLNEGHISKLVETLILEKRWVEETASLTFPFKLALPAKRKLMPSNGHGSNGLSSLFSGRTSHSNSWEKPDNHLDGESVEARPPQNLAELKAWFLTTCSVTEDITPEEFQKLFESKFKRKLLSSCYGYPTIRSLFFACSADSSIKQGMKKRPLRKEEILLDCRKLLMDLLKENPQGFNMGTFRPAFIDRYGYILDCQMLGYPKLASLLQTMPEVRIESAFVLPASMLSSDSNLASKKALAVDPDSESTSNGEDWEELGPVSDDKAAVEDRQMTYSKVSLSDEEFTDSDDEVPSGFDGSRNQPKRGEEDSSLMQILDSWYSNKESGNGKDQGHSSEELDESSRSNQANISNRSLTNNPKRGVRAYKPYSFVADSSKDEKDKLVDNILGTLQKAGDSRSQSYREAVDQLKDTPVLSKN